MEEPASADFPRIRPPPARPPAARGGGKGVRARPGTLIHPYLDKIFTNWVAIKDLDVSQTRNLTRISVRIFLEGSRGPYLNFFFTIFGPQHLENVIFWSGKTAGGRAPQPWGAWKIQKLKFWVQN